MQGNTQVIDALNRALTIELTAINQYFCQAKMCKNWGFMKLAGKHYEESIGEMKHAEEVIDRILYLDGVPNMQKYMRVNVGQTIPEMHQFDLDLERDAVTRLNAGVELCRAKGDNGSRLVAEKILHDEEGHIDWLEAQLTQIQIDNLPTGWGVTVTGDDGGSMNYASGVYTTAGNPASVILTVTLTPPADSDVDVATLMGGNDITFTATAEDPESGDTADSAPVVADVNVDAVADPVGVTITVNDDAADDGSQFSPGETGSVKVTSVVWPGRIMTLSRRSPIRSCHATSVCSPAGTPVMEKPPLSSGMVNHG